MRRAALHRWPTSNRPFPAAGSTRSTRPPARRSPASPTATARDVDAAVAAAHSAFPAWSRHAGRRALAPAARRRRPHRRPTSKASPTPRRSTPASRSACRGAVDIPRAAANFRFFATAILHYHAEAYRTDRLALNYTLRQPRGVAGLHLAVEPAAVPVHLEGRPGAGDRQHRRRQAVRADADDGSPAERRLRQRGGPAAGRAQRRPRLRAQGRGRPRRATRRCRRSRSPAAPATGAEIARAAAPLFKKCRLELGGKNPNIVFADADLDEALPTSVRGVVREPGRDLPVRLAHLRRAADLYARFVERFVAADEEAARSATRSTRTRSRGR